MSSTPGRWFRSCQGITPVGGRVTTNIGSSHAYLQSIALDGSGRIVAAGSVWSPGYDFALARYTPAGTLDPSFGTGGVVVTAFGSSYDEITSVAIDREGRIVVGGYTRNTQSDTDDFALARYTDDGSLDPT